MAGWHSGLMPCWYSGPLHWLSSFLFFWLRILPEYYFLAQAFANLHGKRRQALGDAFRAGLRKLGPKNNIPEVFLTRKAKNMNHGSPLFPTDSVVCWLMHWRFDPNQGGQLCAVCMLLCVVSSFAVLPEPLIYIHMGN